MGSCRFDCHWWRWTNRLSALQIWICQRFKMITLIEWAQIKYVLCIMCKSKQKGDGGKTNKQTSCIHLTKIILKTESFIHYELLQTNPVGFKHHVKGELWCNNHGTVLGGHTTKSRFTPLQMWNMKCNLVDFRPHVYQEYTGKERFASSSTYKVIAERYFTRGRNIYIYIVMESVFKLVNATLKNCIVVFSDSMHVWECIFIVQVWLQAVISLSSFMWEMVRSLPFCNPMEQSKDALLLHLWNGLGTKCVTGAFLQTSNCLLGTYELRESSWIMAKNKKVPDMLSDVHFQFGFDPITWT